MQYDMSHLAERMNICPRKRIAGQVSNDEATNTGSSIRDLSSKELCKCKD